MVNTVLTGWKSKISEKLVKALNLQTAIDKVPNELINTIQPVFNVEEDKEVLIQATNNTGTIFTTDETRRTFITASFLNCLYDTSAGSCYITVTLKNGKSVRLQELYKSIYERNIFLFEDYSTPIELLKGSSVSVTFADNIPYDMAKVFYYEVD